MQQLLQSYERIQMIKGTVTSQKITSHIMNNIFVWITLITLTILSIASALILCIYTLPIRRFQHDFITPTAMNSPRTTPMPRLRFQFSQTHAPGDYVDTNITPQHNNTVTSSRATQTAPIYIQLRRIETNNQIDTDIY